MADELSGADIDALPPRAAAAAIALGAAGHDPAVAHDAALYLRKQVELADLQIADIRREDQLRHWSIVVHHTSDLLRLALELALAVIVVGFVVAVASAIWTASHDDSLVIEPFSVPPQMAQSGLTGEAIAAQLQDKLAAMQEATDSARPAKSYANSWDDGIKVMIPNTGISVGDVYRTLAGWFGHQTHITGEVYVTKAGIAITSRSNGTGGTTVTGGEADFDTLIGKSAEAIYHRTQPYRYAVYLSGRGRFGDSMPIYQALAAKGDLEDRLWSHMGISTYYEVVRPLEAPAENRKALAIDPAFALAYQNIAGEEDALGHADASLAATQAPIPLLAGGDGKMSARASAISLPYLRGNVAAATGDFDTARKQFAATVGLPDFSHIAEASQMQGANVLAHLHELRAAEDAWSNISLRPGPVNLAAFSYYPQKVESDIAAGNPRAALADAAAAEGAYRALLVRLPMARADVELSLARQIRPWEALARAETGDLAAARALIDATPGDCYPCMRARGQIHALEKDGGAAEYWFARAVWQSPSIPFAYADWGRMLVAKGDLDGAIAKFAAAHEKGPHFADPLELWGEALVAKNRSDLALAKFEEAAKYAPNWQRLHQKWGEALFYAGRKDDAAKQFALAKSLAG
jgi:tetratricopeptide (TPR) repeat protein